MNKQKWLALPFGLHPAVSGGGGLPTLIVLAPDGTELTRLSGASKAMLSGDDDPRLFKDLALKMSDREEAHAAECARRRGGNARYAGRGFFPCGAGGFRAE